MRDGFIRKKVQKVVSKTGIQIRFIRKKVQKVVSKAGAQINMAWSNSWIEKKYGKKLVHDRTIIAAFVGTFTVVISCLWPLLVAEDDTYLAKTGTLTSIGVGVLGVYIAVWLINQKRTKTIEGNHYYKLLILIFVKGVFEHIIVFNNEIQEAIENKELSIERYRSIKNAFMTSHYSKDGFIISGNSNTFVPDDIKIGIVFLLLHIRNIITVSKLNSPFIKPDDDLAILQDSVFNSKYFTAERDEYLRKMLKDLQDMWDKIRLDS